MVQIIPPKNLNAFGQLAEGFANQANKTLSQSLPQYIEQGMLSRGLKNLSQKQDLTPQQYYHELLSIPGVVNHPSIIEGAQKLAREQMHRQSLSRRANRQSEGASPVNRTESTQSIRDMQIGPMTRNSYSEPLNQTPQGSTPQKVKVNVSPEPAFMEKSPLSPGQAPFRSSPDYIYDKAAQFQEEFPGLSPDQYLQMAKEYEGREKAFYESQREAQLEKEGITKEIRRDLSEAIKNKLQKEGKGIYEDITGDFEEKLQENLRKDLLYHPELSRQEAIQKWSNKAFEHAKNVKEIKNIASSNEFSQTKLNKLKSLQKLFADNDSLQEFKNLLEANFEFSPQYAAKIAYPRSKEVANYIKNVKPRQDADKNSLKSAEDISKMIGANDSPLAIASSLKYRMPNFNESLFFSYLRDHIDELPLKEWQKRELVQGEKSLSFNWGDFWHSPWVGRSVIND